MYEVDRREAEGASGRISSDLRILKKELAHEGPELQISFEEYKSNEDSPF